MQILIAGGTGTIGRRLVYHLLQYGHVVKVVSRQPFRPANLPAKIVFAEWDGKSAQGWGNLVEGADAVVNLAGAGIADEAWTEARKKEIEESRVNAGKAVVEAISAASVKPKVLIQSSAVGYYGVQNNDQVLTEDTPPANDFLGRTCQAWEASTAAVEALGVRRVIIRTGVVLDMQGGALPKMVLPFRFFAGGPIGNGRQWFPWIHYCDEVEAIRFLIQTEAASGPFNLTAPNPVRSSELAKAIGKVMKRPAFAPAPAFAFKTMFGEMATVLLDGQQAVPKRLQELGYQFKFSQVEAALRDVLA
ncbi:MAG: TIGR01777 family protein [Anaerolineales bacterium]|nr:TIGR01777 family protein [Anaerolineales bacterium]